MLYLFEDYALDTERRELSRGNELVAIEPKVFDLLAFVIENRQRVVSRDDLIAQVWDGRIVSESALARCIYGARSAIGDNGEAQRLIKTFPRKGIRFVGAVKEEQQQPAAGAAAAVAAEPTAPALALPDRPSIAVLPFANVSGDSEQEYFADGMADEIITALSRCSWLFVTARNSSFTYKNKCVDARQIGRELGVRYLLEGSVRRGGDRVRFAAQLIEADVGRHIWADRFEGDLNEVFELQDRIAASVVGAIEPSLRDAEIERARRKPPENLNAYDHYLRALPHAYGYTREGRALALDLLGKALAIDPSYAEAHGLAAWCHIQRIWAESPDLSADLASALTHAKAVMTIRTDDASTLAFAAAAYARAARDYERAIQMIEHALARNPSNAHALAVGAMVNVFAQRLDLTIELAERALRCSPFDPIRYLALTAIAHAKLLQGDTEHALVAARRAVHASPGFLPTHGFVLICLVRLGRAQELPAAVERLLTSFPDLRLTNFTAHPPFEPFIPELTAAGLPA